MTDLSSACKNSIIEKKSSILEKSTMKYVQDGMVANMERMKCEHKKKWTSMAEEKELFEVRKRLSTLVHNVFP